MKELLSVIEINLDKPIDKMIEEILNHLEIKGEDLEEIDFEIKMYSGEKIGFKYHVGKGIKQELLMILTWILNLHQEQNGNMSMSWRMKNLDRI